MSVWYPGFSARGGDGHREMLALLVAAPLLAASSYNRSSRQLDWFPCVEAGRCGTSVTILPDHELIHYHGFVTLDRSQQRARFDRAPFGAGSVLRMMSPATRISFRTNAHRVIVVLEYRGKRACSADCPLVASGGCYEAKPCPNQCEVLLEIDGQSASGSWTNLVDIALTGDDARLDFLGEVAPPPPPSSLRPRRNPHCRRSHRHRSHHRRSHRRRSHRRRSHGCNPHRRYRHRHRRRHRHGRRRRRRRRRCHHARRQPHRRVPLRR